MFKKLTTYVTLFAFFNNSCVEPALAVGPKGGLVVEDKFGLSSQKIALEKRDDDVYVLNYRQVEELSENAVNLSQEGQDIATLLMDGDKLEILNHSKKKLELRPNQSFAPFFALDIFVDEQDCGTAMIVENKVRLQRPGAKELLLKPCNMIKLMVGQEDAGTLYRRGDMLQIMALGKRHLMLSALPEVDQLLVQNNGPVTFDNVLKAKSFLSANSVGPMVFRQGLHISDPKGFACLEAQSLELFGDSMSQMLKLVNVGSITVNKGAKLEAEGLQNTALTKGADGKAIESQGVLKALTVYGQLLIRTFEAKEITTLTNDGTTVLGMSQAHIETLVSSGVFQVAFATITKAWNTTKEALTTIAAFLHVDGDEFFDDGNTSVYGLALVDANGARLGGTFSARKAQVSSEDTLALDAGAKIFVQEHITLRGGNDLNLMGGVYFTDFTKEWPALTLPEALQEHFDRLPAGAYLSALNHLCKKGDVKSDFDTVYRAITYDGVDGENRAGPFNGTISVVAENAILADHMRSYGNAIVQASRRAELKGVREIAQVFAIETLDLQQLKGDVAKAGVISYKAEDAELAGHNEFKKALSVDVAKDFHSTESFVAKAEQKGALAVINAKNGLAILGGQYQDVTLQVDGKDVVEDSSFRGKLIQSHLSGERIFHEKHSEHHVEGQGLSSETATQDIIYREGSSNKAGTNLLKAGNRIFNSGSIESAMRYLGDCQYHSNMNGGRIRAPMLTIMADQLNYNYMATLDGDYTEINTLRNENLWGGRIRGRDALKINALLYNYSAPGSMMFSSNATINTAMNLSIPFTSYSGPDISSVQGFAGSFLEPTYLVSKGFNLAAGVATGGWLLAVRGLQLAWQLGQLGYGLHKIYSLEDKEDSPEDYHRWSRRAKRWGDSMGLVYSAASTALQVKLLINDGIKHFKPLEDTKPPANKNQPVDGNANQPTNGATNQPTDGNTSPQEPVSETPKEFTDKVEELKQSAPAAEEPWFDFEKCQNSALKYGKEGLLYYVGSSLEVNSILDLDFGLNLAGHERRRALFYAGYSPTSALTRDISCLWGADYKEDWTYRSNVSAFYDLSLGNQKHVWDTYRAHAGRNVHVAGTFKADPTQGEVKADGTMYVANGAQSEDVAFESAGDMNFGGNITGGASGWVASKEGKATLLAGGEMHADKNTLFGNTAETQAGSAMGGKDSTVYGTKGALNNGSMQANTNQVLAPEGEAKSTGLLQGETNILRGLTAEMAGQAKGTDKEGGGDLLWVEGTNGAKVTGNNDNQLLLVSSEKGEATITDGATNNAKYTTLLDVNGCRMSMTEEPEQPEPAGGISAVQEPASSNQDETTDKSEKPASAVAGVWAKLSEDGRVLASNYPGFHDPTGEDDRLLASVKRRGHKERTEKKNKQITDKPSQPTEEQTPEGPVSQTPTEIEMPALSAAELETLLRSLFPNVESITFVDGKAFIANPVFENYQDFQDFFEKKGKYAALPFNCLATFMNQPITFQQPEGYVAPTRREMAEGVRKYVEERIDQDNKDRRKLHNSKISHDSAEYKEAKSRHAHFYRDMIGLKLFEANVKSGKVLPENPLLMCGYSDFMLVAPQIQVGPYLNVMTAGVFQFVSAVKPFILHEGSTVGAQVMNYIESPKGIEWWHNRHREWDEHHKYVEAVRFDQSTFMGGVGLLRDFENPLDHTVTQRMVGLWLKTDGKAEGVGGNFISLGDIWIHATKGFANDGRAQLLLVDYEKDHGWLKTSKQRKWTYDTEFLTGLISTPGMLVILCEEGEFRVVGGLIRAGNGAYVIARDGHKFDHLMGRKGRIKERNAKINWFNSEHIKMSELEETTAIVNTGNMPMYFWAVDKDGNKSGNTDFRGEIHSTEGGLTSMMGKKLFLKRQKLKHVNSHRGPSSSREISLNPMIKAGKALRALKGLIEECNFEAFGQELKGMVSPTAKIRFAFGSSKTKSQTLGKGGINTTYLFLDYDEVRLTNGFNVKYEEAEVYIKDLYLKGVLLVTEYESTSFGLWAAASGNGASVGVDLNHTFATFEQLAKATFGGGKTKGRIDNIYAHGADVNLGDTSECQIGHEEHKEMTPHNHVESYGVLVGVNQNFVPLGSANATIQNDGKGITLNANGNQEDGISGGGVVKTKHTDTGLQFGPEGSSGQFNYNNKGLNVGVDGHTNGQVGVHGSKQDGNANVNLGIGVGSDGQPTAEGGIKTEHVDIHGQVDPEGKGTLHTNYTNDGLKIGVEGNTDDRSLTGSIEKGDFNGTATVNTDGNYTAQVENENRDVVIGVTGEVDDPKVTAFAGEIGQEPFAQHTFDLGKPKSIQPTAAPQQPLAWTPIEDLPLNQPEAQLTDLPLNTTTATGSDMQSRQDPLLPQTQGLGGTSDLPSMAQLSAMSRAIVNATTPSAVPIAPEINANPKVYPLVSGLEELDAPLMIKGQEFRYRIPGTNYYLQDPSQYDKVIEAINELNSHPDEYSKLAQGAINNQNRYVLFFDAELTPYGQPGSTVKTDGKSCIMIATEATDPYLSIKQNLAHEGGHAANADAGGSYTPGYVQHNEALSLQNKQEIIANYAEDLKANGYNSLDKMPRGVHSADNISGFKLFHAPWEYFKNELVDALLKEGIILSPSEMGTLLKQAEQSILSGALPSSIEANDGIRRCLQKAETQLIDELPAFLGEVNIKDPALANKFLGNTKQCLQDMHPGMPETAVKPAEPHGKSAIGKVAPFVDYVVHVAVEQGKQTTPDTTGAMVDALLPTMSDAVVYNPIFNVAAKGGWIGVATTTTALVGSHFLPYYSDEDIRRQAELLQQAQANNDGVAMAEAEGNLQFMAGMNGLKMLMEMPQQVSDFICDGTADLINEVSPTLLPNIKTGLKLANDMLVNDLNKTSHDWNKLFSAALPDVDQKQIKTISQIWEEALHYREAMIQQNQIDALRPHFQVQCGPNEKGKEEAK